ncbi:DUF499 domain-containing protein [Mucilaginibacter sp.]|jgi:hypothetical protein|uniref:DUF499 domain-containing protein n=1 Tax=Mucilaginibacter sp. TaxID=1882438 RepID=UPI003567CB52
MAIAQQQQDNLFKAFGLFIEAFRPYVVSVLQTEAGDKWPALFVEALYPGQKDSWNLGLRAGSSPETLIDYPYLKAFSLRYKDLLKVDFGKDINKLATRLETIYDTRNKLAHFQEISVDEFVETFIQMKSIAKSLNMDELETELAGLQELKATIHPIAPVKQSGDLEPWFRVVTPHMDIRQGRLDESVFAANLAEVALNTGREIYNNPVVFFSKTFFTAGLKSIAKTVISGLNGNEDAENRVISLQTGFGGGKTHTLISLYHLGKWGKQAIQSQYTQELLAYTGNPTFDSAKIAVFTNTTNDPANGRTTAENLHIQTIWGELAYQLGGVSAYEIIRKNDEQLIAPAGLFKKVLEQCTPALILIDELADYCVKASARMTGNSSLADQTISFVQELTEAVAATNNCVAVITLPASPQEVGNTPEAQSILNSLQKRVSRVGADTQPVADDEIYEVIRRRLFEDIGSPQMIEAVSSKYLELYQSSWTELPSNANKMEYKQRMLKAYPFHPELIDIFRVRWASHHDFQRTRGALRLLAAIVSDLWKRQQTLPGANLLIHSGEVNFANLDAMSGQLKRLYGNGYDAVITADVAGSSSNAFKIDVEKKEYGQWNLTKSIASVILMNSFGNEGSNKGISVPEIKLQLLTPGGFNHNSINGALDELENDAYYLYYAQAGGNGKRYWFHTKPNINILINQAKSDIKNENIDAEIIKKIKEKERTIQLFNVLVDSPADIPEQLKPTLLILSPKYFLVGNSVSKSANEIIEKLSTKKGNSERIYRNTLLFLLCSEVGVSKLNADVRDYLACQKIYSEYQGQLEQDQKQEVRKRMEEAEKQAIGSLAAAYSVLAKYSVKNGIELLTIKQFKDTFENQVNYNIIGALKEEEWLLESVGLNVLRNNNLLPSLTQPIKAKDIYEAFIRFDDKPMITGLEAINKSIIKYCYEGHYCIASGDGTTFSKYYLSENVPFFDAADISYWLIDKSLKPKPEDPLKETNDGNTNPVPSGGGATQPIQPNVANISDAVKQFKSITISGKVPLERYTELFNYFITPFAMNGNKIDIEVRFKVKSNDSSPLDESKQQYKSAKEASKQLGLDFEEDTL